MSLRFSGRLKPHPNLISRSSKRSLRPCPTINIMLIISSEILSRKTQAQSIYLKILTPKKSVSKWVVAGKDNTPIRRNVLLFNAAPNSWNNPNKLRKSPNWRCHRARCPGCERLEIGFAFPHFYSAAAGTRVTRRTPGTFSPSNYFHPFQCRESRHPRPQSEHSQPHDGGRTQGPSLLFFLNSTSFFNIKASCPFLYGFFSISSFSTSSLPVRFVELQRRRRRRPCEPLRSPRRCTGCSSRSSDLQQFSIIYNHNCI